MTSRKKAGVGFFITAAFAIVIGGVKMFTDVDPAWIAAIPDKIVPIVNLIASAFGVYFTYPGDPS